MKQLSIIIVTYNSNNYIKNCLDSIFQYNDIDQELEVIMVDNSFEAVSLEMETIINDSYLNKVKFIKNDKNGGYGYGNNIGINTAVGKYIAIMNPDITMTEPLFFNAIQQFEKDKNLGILGYKQYGAFNLSFFYKQEYYIPILTPALTKICNRANWFIEKQMYLSGAYFFTKKESFGKIGNFDENIFLYCEESDITNRFLNAGYSIKYDSSKSYRHEIDGRKEMSNSGFKYLLDSYVYYLKKFSFSQRQFLDKLEIELKFKKILYKIVGNRERKLAVDNHLQQVINFKKSIS